MEGTMSWIGSKGEERGEIKPRMRGLRTRSTATVVVLGKG